MAFAGEHRAGRGRKPVPHPADSAAPGGSSASGPLGRLTGALPWMLVVAGLVLLALPVASDWYAAWQAGRAISEITSVYDDMSDPERLENLEQARAWNAALRGEDPGMDVWDYRVQLTYRSTPASMMAWLEVPKIATRLPIYHGTDEAVLAAGVGHCDWSALPVGGEGNRPVLTAHSGLDRTRMFDDIRRLDTGDAFVVWALGEPHAYEVRDVQVILPEEADLLKAEPGRDLCSLVTCTPIGVNSHRLVVTGERCEYEPVMEGPQDVEPYVNGRTVPLLAGMALVLLVALRLAARRRRKPLLRPGRRHRGGEGPSVSS